MTRDESRRRAVEGNLWSMWSQFGRGPGCALHDQGGALWFETPVPVPPYNMVIRFEGGADADATIDRIFDCFTRRAVPFLWMLHESSSPPDLADRLRRRGLADIETITGMAMDLSRLPAVPTPAPGVRVEEVTTEEHIATYMGLVAARWGVPDVARTDHRALAAIVGMSAPTPNRSWIAYRDRQPVAKAFTHDGAGTTGLYGMATLPEARGLGLGRLLALTALHDARRRGSTTAVLHSTPMAVSLYERLGFETVLPFRLFAAPGSFYA